MQEFYPRAGQNGGMESCRLFSFFINAAICVFVGAQSAPEVPPSYFDAGGYYFPQQPIIRTGYRVDWIELETVSYLVGGKLDYDHPKILKPRASIRLQSIRHEKVWKNSECENPVISRQEISVRCKTVIGEITVHGRFSNTNGQFWNQATIHNEVVMEAEVVISDRNHHEVYRQHQAFTYWEGD